MYFEVILLNEKCTTAIYKTLKQQYQDGTVDYHMDKLCASKTVSKCVL